MKVLPVVKDIRSNYVYELFKSRGVTDLNAFLNPTEASLQSWRALDNISHGIELIRGFDEGTYGIIVDSDVDGFTSAAIFINYMKELKPNLRAEFYLHTGKQHGLEDKWEELAAKDYKFIVCPDSASNDSQYAKELSCPILVLDHHILESPITSYNMIVINNQCSPAYHNKFLSGAGVTYQFCRALDDVYGVHYSDKYIDLAALGIDGDMMSALEIENQYIWHKGFNSVHNTFFKALIDKQSYSMGGKVNPISVAFYIVPLINAMIRVGTDPEKERLFLAFIDPNHLVPSGKRGEKGMMTPVYMEACRECTNARTHQNKTKDEVVERLEQKIFKHDLLENKILFIRLDDDDIFPSELNGLVAMNLSAKYKRPTIVARLNDEGFIRGSARGVNNSELTSFKNFLNGTGLFEYTLGHDQAFGVSIPNASLSHLHEIANKELAQYDFGTECYEVDFSRYATDKDIVDLISNISKYSDYWGTMNNEPLIYIQSIHITSADIQVMGKLKDTLKIVKNGIAYMKFHANDMIEELNEHNDIILNVVGRANMNEWMGKYTPQIFIDAYEIKENNIVEF